MLAWAKYFNRDINFVIFLKELVKMLPNKRSAFNYSNKKRPIRSHCLPSGKHLSYRRQYLSTAPSDSYLQEKSIIYSLKPDLTNILQYDNNINISIKVIASDIDPCNLRLREAVLIKKLKPTINNKDELESYRDFFVHWTHGWKPIFLITLLYLSL